METQRDTYRERTCNPRTISTAQRLWNFWWVSKDTGMGLHHHRLYINWPDAKDGIPYYCLISQGGLTLWSLEQPSLNLELSLLRLYTATQLFGTRRSPDICARYLFGTFRLWDLANLDMGLSRQPSFPISVLRSCENHNEMGSSKICGLRMLLH